MSGSVEYPIEVSTRHCGIVSTIDACSALTEYSRWLYQLVYGAFTRRLRQTAKGFTIFVSLIELEEGKSYPVCTLPNMIYNFIIFFTKTFNAD